jgi:hypothetical protein
MTTQTNLFAICARRKYRFPFPGKTSTLSVEDVWDLPLKARVGRTEPSLNELAQILNELVESLPKRSFVDDEDATKPSDPDHAVHKLEIVKAIIATKKDEAKSREGAAVQAGQISELDALIARKKAAELESLPLEELERRRNAVAAASLG